MREHSGGYINQAAYWDIGTEAARGRDGDTRREAAKKYNDHKHPAALIQTADDLVAWANEPQLSSGMGYLQDNAAQLARNAGDMALFGGRLYASDGLGGVFPVSGLGGTVSVTQQGNAVVQPDVLSYTTALAAPVRYGVGSVGEGVSIACGSAQFLDTDMRVSTATRQCTRTRLICRSRSDRACHRVVLLAARHHRRLAVCQLCGRPRALARTPALCRALPRLLLRAALRYYRSARTHTLAARLVT